MIRRFILNMVGAACGVAVGYIAVALVHHSFDVTAWPKDLIPSSLLLMYAIGFLGYVVSDWRCKEVG